MKIEKKVIPVFFQKIFDGKKKFEVRLADFDCKPGDVLILKEWDPKKKAFTGRAVEKRINYVLKTKDLTFWKKEDIDRYGYQVISFD